MTHPQRVRPFLYSTGLVATALLATGLLAGCGQKGPLFLPGSPADVRSEVPASDGAAPPETATEELDAGGETDAEDDSGADDPAVREQP